MSSPSVQSTFDDRLKAARLTYVNDYFTAGHNACWTDKGTTVRGSFHLVDMDREWSESDLEATLATESERLGRNLRLATAYELVAYAANGWNGTDWVVAYGSAFAHPDGGRYVAYLWGSSATRGLDRYWADDSWNARGRVLCVCE